MRATVVLALAYVVGCGAVDEDTTSPEPYSGPGSQAWGDTDISCESTSDCLSGELCEEGFCMIDRCSGDLSASTAPLGKGHTFLRDDEIALADSTTYQGSYWLDGFDPDTVSYDGSWEVGGDSIADVAGGAFYGHRPETYAVAVTGSRTIEFPTRNSSGMTIDFEPIALAGGDIDLDGYDELAAVSSDGELALCEVGNTADCEYFNFSGSVTIYDVAMGDVDGDAIHEPILLIDSGGERYLYAFNADFEETGQVESWSINVEDGIGRVSAGDLDGDYFAEIVVTNDSGWWGWADDYVGIFGVADTTSDALYMVMEEEVDGFEDIYDLEVADVDMDDLGELYILMPNAEVYSMDYSTYGLSERDYVNYSPSDSPDRIAVADHSGDAPLASLKNDGQACNGRAVPLVTLVLPPYDAEHSNGVSSVFYGEGESTSETFSDTVSLGVGMDVGVSAEFWSVFKAKMSTSVSWRMSQSTSVSEKLYVSSRFSLSADPEMYGPNYGGVVLAWGCFDAYTYELDDPKGAIDSGGGEFVLTVPTGGGSSIWSTARYNAMAAVNPDLPAIEIPYTVGDPTSYPASVQRLDGQPVNNQDLIFPDPTDLAISDVGTVSFYQRTSEDQTNSVNTDISIGASAGVTVAGISVGANTSAGWGEGYSLSVGSDALFGGSLPPIPDDPDTPEDEYGAHAYSMRPYVYVHDYSNIDGNESAFYVMTYTVGQ